MNNLGMKVTINFKANSPYNGSKTVLRNVTEIHHNYNFERAKNAPVNSFLKETRIAFESNIHYTGCTYFVEDIEEFSTSLETEKAESF
jgi:hypothetical protein